MDNLNHPLTRDFTSCLESSGFQQHTHVPTHSKGHILDLICCSGITPIDCTAAELPITDHFLLSFNVNVTLSTKISPPHLISFRNIMDINMDSLSSSIDSLLDIGNLSTPEELVSYYNTGLHDILNSLTPLKTRSVSFSLSAPWFTPELRLMKAKGRQLERLHRKTGLTVHKEMYKNHFLHYHNLICSNEGNTKSLFSLFNNITRSPVSIPSHLYSTAFCNSHVFFQQQNPDNPSESWF